MSSSPTRERSASPFSRVAAAREPAARSPTARSGSPRSPFKSRAHDDDEEDTTTNLFEEEDHVARPGLGAPSRGKRDEVNKAAGEDEAPAKASVHVPISERNAGFQLLKKLGWKEGSGIGRVKGRVDPIPFSDHIGTLGLGKLEQDLSMAATAAVRPLSVAERLEKESDEERRRRESRVARDAERDAEVREVRRKFYCDVCDKQYAKAGEFENHLSSYDHHHVKRAKELRDAERAANPTAATDEERRARRREEKEIQRMMAAATGASLKPAAPVAPVLGLVPPPPPPPSAAAAAAMAAHAAAAQYAQYAAYYAQQQQYQQNPYAYAQMHHQQEHAYAYAYQAQQYGAMMPQYQAPPPAWPAPPSTAPARPPPPPPPAPAAATSAPAAPAQAGLAPAGKRPAMSFSLGSKPAPAPLSRK
ncbi:hypothetical protein H9P43_005510 [Blastocladiella emersonii ATCC 22665]|nr:hypothetical protein H9P43_005510 [Blastocladiella emersonii ATCC 22665]